MSKHTSGQWRTECVSDACRVVVGSGRQKWILARLATKQISERETAANARLMAAAPELLAACKLALSVTTNSLIEPKLRELISNLETHHE